MIDCSYCQYNTKDGRCLYMIGCPYKEGNIFSMTPEEFKERMKKICKDDDYNDEELHIFADDLMCKLLRSLGYGDGVEIFEAAPKWYS